MTLPDLEQVPPERRGRLIEAIERSLRSFSFFCKFWLRFTPHEKQRAFANPRIQHVGMSCGTGFGKTAILSAWLLWRTFCNPGHKYLALAPTRFQSSLILGKMADQIANGGNMLSLFIKRTPTKDDPWMVFTNGARILFFHTAYGAVNLQGTEFNGGAIDEAGLIGTEPYEIFQDRIRLMPAWTRIASSPKGKTNIFYRECMRLREKGMIEERLKERIRHAYIQASSWDNPYYPRERLEEAKERKPRLLYQQDIMGEFVDAQGATFKQEEIDRVFDAKWEGEAEPRAMGLYVNSWDYGRKRSFTVATTLAYDQQKDVFGEIRGVDQVDYWGVDWPIVFTQINEREIRWGSAGGSSETIHDATGLGDVIDRSVEISAIPYIFTGPARGEMIVRMQTSFQKVGRMRLPRHWSALYSQCQLHTLAEDADDQTWDHFDSLGLGNILATERLQLGSSIGGRL